MKIEEDKHILDRSNNERWAGGLGQNAPTTQKHKWTVKKNCRLIHPKVLKFNFLVTATRKKSSTQTRDPFCKFSDTKHKIADIMIINHAF